MYSLVYRSVARPVFGLKHIEKMLHKARVFNKEHQITGCLLYYQGRFLQYLEGSQAEVLRLFDKISKDPRHERVELVAYSVSGEREFHDWDMAYENAFGENQMINYLRLKSQNLERMQLRPNSPNRASEEFWKLAGQILNQKTA